MKAGQDLEVTAERLDDAGRGVSSEGLRVADLLPGESAVAHVEHVSRHGGGAWGSVLTRVGEPALSRRSPACPAFGRCGGCVWQHQDLAAQLAAKQDRIVEAFSAAGLEATPPPVVSSASSLGYRNKGKYVVGERDGELILGAYEPRSHRITSTLGCAIVEPAIDDTAFATRDILGRHGLKAYDENTRTGAVRYVVVRAGVDGRVVATLITGSNASPSQIDSAAAELLDASPATGVLWGKNDRTDGAILDQPRELVVGDAFVGERLGGVLVDVDPSAFWQVNRAQAETIYARIGELIAGGRSVLDAYAGVGAIGLAAAKQGAAVTTIEIEATATAVTQAAAKALELDLTVLCGDAALALDNPFDTVIVNPPRRGLSDDVRTRLGEGSAAVIIYLSCNPESLARDLAVLCERGFEIETTQGFDMMPGTPQIEVLVSLRRR